MKRSTITLLIFLFSFVTMSYGQTINSQSVSGTIKDQRGAVVAKATVAVTNTGTGFTKTVKSNADGNFTALDLPIGTYTVTTLAPGFKKSVVQGVIVQVGDKLRVSVTLQVGELVQTVVVEATPVQVETGSSLIGSVITSVEATGILLDGRNYVQLMSLAPGVSVSSSGFGLFSSSGEQGSNQSIDGDRTDSTNYFIDGVDNKDNGGGGNNYVAISPDALEEFRLASTSYDATYGGSSGAGVNVALRSGTKAFHGEGYEFIRNNAIQAYQFQPLGTTHPTKPPLRYNDFGWTLGGPIYIPGHFNANRGKLFFFAGQEFRRQTQSTVTTTAVPSASQKIGDFSQYPSSQWPINPVTKQPFPGGIVPSCGTGETAGCATANGVALAKLFPKANAGANFIYGSPNPLNTQETFFRIDDLPSDKNQISGTFVYDKYARLGNPGGLITYQGKETGFISSIQWTRTLNTRTLNTLTFSYSGNALTQSKGDAPNPIFGLTSFSRTANGLNYPTLYNVSNAVPSVSVQGFSGISSTPVSQDNYERIYGLRDDFSKIIGNNTLRLGIYAWRNRKNQTTPPAVNGSFGFTGNTGQSGQLTTNQALANELMGLFATYNEGNSISQVWMRFTQIEPYIQDDWTVNHRLVLNLGFRWQYMQPMYSALNNISVFSPQYYNPAQAATINPATGVITSNPYPYNGMVLPGSGFPSQAAGRVFQYGNPAVEALFHNLPRSLTSTYWNTSAPRLGFAYDLTGKHTTVLRGGFGLSYARLEGNYFFNSSKQIPFTDIANVLSGNMESISGAAPAAAQPAEITNSYAQNLAPARVKNWSVGIQHQLFRDTVVQINYVGSSSGNLIWSQNLAELPAGTTQANPGVSVNALRPYKGYQDIFQFVNGAISNYNSLQAELTKHMGADGMLNVSYTYSQCLTDDSSFGTHPQSAFNLPGEYGRCNYNQPKILVVGYVYPLPFWQMGGEWYQKALGGWRVSGITRISSGLPLTINQANNTNVSGNGVTTINSARPNLVGNPYAFVSKGGKVWLNKGAFPLPAAGTFGDLRPSAINGPNYNNWDIALLKTFQLRENTGVEFRAEMYNFPNHLSAYNVQTNLGNGNFGQKTGALDPRTMQFGLKVHF